jgi:hypothetical protein
MRCAVQASLIFNDLPAELGFLAVLSVEPIYECLAENHMLPECQKAAWGDFWNTDFAAFANPDGLQVASVHVHDDGRRSYFEIVVADRELLNRSLTAALAVVGDVLVDKEVRERARDTWVRVQLKCDPEHAGRLVKLAAKAAEKVIGEGVTATEKNDTDAKRRSNECKSQLPRLDGHFVEVHLRIDGLRPNSDVLLLFLGTDRHWPLLPVRTMRL